LFTVGIGLNRTDQLYPAHGASADSLVCRGDEFVAVNMSAGELPIGGEVDPLEAGRCRALLPLPTHVRKFRDLRLLSAALEL